jgi:hypothetical protein
MTQSIRSLITIHSSITMKTITEKRIRDLDLFKNTQNKFNFSYYIYKEEDEKAVITINLSL